MQTLLNVYEKQTGLKGHEQVIGGGYSLVVYWNVGRLTCAMRSQTTDTMAPSQRIYRLDDLFLSSSNLCQLIMN